MKKITFLTIFTALFLFTITSCSDASNEQLPEKSTELTTSHADTFLSKLNKEDAQRLLNLQISQSKEIPTGNKNFDMIVKYIWKHGFIIDGGPDRIPCGKQYTFFDSNGNRHAYLAIKMDTITGIPSMTGQVLYITTYGYHKGIKDQEHFFPYRIDNKKVYNDILKFDNTWPDAEAVTFGYQEFLEKVKKES